MIEQFKNHLQDRFPFLKNSKSLIAISGGIDSVVLARLMSELDYDFALIHCNFNLRGEESDGDEEFVIAIGNELGVEVFTQRFNTKGFAKEEGISIQMAARELRYMWFEELRQTLKYDYILTGHHAQDDLETFFINLSRGSGLDGLTGIPEQNERVLRPLIPFSRRQIKKYVDQNKLEWREDSSNISDKYLRNHIRHHVVPAMEEAAPNFLSQFSKSRSFLQESSQLIEDYTALLYSKIVTESFQGYQLNIQSLKDVPHTKAVLYQLLKDFEFTAWEDIYNLLDAQAGKWVSSGSYRLIKDRGVLLLTVEKEQSLKQYRIAEFDVQIIIENLEINIDTVQEMGVSKKEEAVFDKDMLKYPLTLRKWQEGDYFYPFGMNGKKKVSKFFKDEKFSALDKSAIWLLCSGEDIIWVIGHRTDNRYKVKSDSQNLLKFTATYV